MGIADEIKRDDDEMKDDEGWAEILEMRLLVISVQPGSQILVSDKLADHILETRDIAVKCLNVNECCFR